MLVTDWWPICNLGDIKCISVTLNACSCQFRHKRLHVNPNCFLTLTGAGTLILIALLPQLLLDVGYWLLILVTWFVTTYGHQHRCNRWNIDNSHFIIIFNLNDRSYGSGQQRSCYQLKNFTNWITSRVIKMVISAKKVIEFNLNWKFKLTIILGGNQRYKNSENN